MRYFGIIVLLGLLFMFSCKETSHGPLVDGVGVPGHLSSIKVENLPGAAKISYALPSDSKFLYVLAEYKDDRGIVHTVKSSNYKNYVLLEGFGTESEYTVNLYTVGKSEDRGEPNQVTIKPLKAPVHSTFETLSIVETFGGVGVNFTNKFGSEFIVYTMFKDENGEWVDRDLFYSAAESNQYAVRNFAPEPTEFGFYIIDKWKNRSDTLVATLVPLYEEELDKSLWKDVALLDDFNEPRYSPLYQLWTPGATTYFFQDSRVLEKTGMPTWVTIDFGREYILGRMKINQVSHSNTWRFGSCTPRVFEIWGTNNPTTNWEDWDNLGEYESIKPSGTPVGAPLTDDDLRVNAEGESYDLPISDKSYRYIRYKVLETWGGVNYFCLLELTFWGQVKN